jgi:hypothetical protein
MQTDHGALTEHEHGVVEFGLGVLVEHRVGYDSEAAFSRAFTRAHGLSPSSWRAARSGDAAPD